MVTETDRGLRAASFEDVVMLVDEYPWFALAQKILCEKMSRVGGRELSRRIFADAALHSASREKVAALMRREVYCGDGDIAKLLRKYVGSDSVQVSKPQESVRIETPAVNGSFRGVGDYFSREQYEAVKAGGESLPRFGMNAGRTPGEEGAEQAPEQAAGIQETGVAAMEGARGTQSPERAAADDFCTETIARIYEEQGYFDIAKSIYAKLILAYPEKNTYFAALIEKLNNRQKN